MRHRFNGGGKGLTRPPIFRAPPPCVLLSKNLVATKFPGTAKCPHFFDTAARKKQVERPRSQGGFSYALTAHRALELSLVSRMIGFSSRRLPLSVRLPIPARDSRTEGRRSIRREKAEKYQSEPNPETASSGRRRERSG